MKYFSLLMLTATMLYSSATIFAEESDSFNWDNVINMDLDAFEQPVNNRQQPSLEKGQTFLDETLTALKNGSSKNPNTRDEWQNTPLMWAVGLRDIKAIEYLLAHGADVEAINDEGANPFVWIGLPMSLLQVSDPMYTDLNSMISVLQILLNYNMDIYKPLEYRKQKLNSEISPLAIILAMATDNYLHHSMLINGDDQDNIETLSKMIRYFSSKYKVKISEKTINMVIETQNLLNLTRFSKQRIIEALHMIKCFIEQNPLCYTICPVN